jgi:hypothetical protein
MEHAFGPVLAKSLAQDLVIGSLGSITAAQALEVGVEPRRVWDAVCNLMDLDEDTRWYYLDSKKRRP